MAPNAVMGSEPIAVPRALEQDRQSAESAQRHRKVEGKLVLLTVTRVPLLFPNSEILPETWSG